MKDEWVEYLKSIGIKDLFLKRAEEVFAFYQKLYPDQIEDIFVNEYFDKEGTRQYENIWFFSKTSAMEAKKFLTVDDFDYTPLKQQVKYWAIQKTEYDFHKATTKSRMALYFTLWSRTSCTLKASHENCDQLRDIFFKYVIINVTGSSAIA